jgi:hypothetical protein
VRPTDLPSPATLAGRHPPGTRVRYLTGRCRCDACRHANTDYEKTRAAARRTGDWNGLVSAAAARRHLRALARAGVGRRSVEDIAGVPASTLHEIKLGRKTQIRARTERRIFNVTTKAMNDARLVPGGPTWKRLRRLLAEGFSRAWRAPREMHAMRLLRIRSLRRGGRADLRVGACAGGRAECADLHVLSRGGPRFGAGL